MESLASHCLDLLPSNSTSLIEPIMRAFSSLLLLGAVATQAVLGRPDAARIRREAVILKRSVDSFIATESPIALRNLLCNIGSDGCYASGASPGVVIASPSKENPDCLPLLLPQVSMRWDINAAYRLLHLVKRCCPCLQVSSRHSRQ